MSFSAGSMATYSETAAESFETLIECRQVYASLILNALIIETRFSEKGDPPSYSEVFDICFRSHWRVGSSISGLPFEITFQFILIGYREKSKQTLNIWCTFLNIV